MSAPIFVRQTDPLTQQITAAKREEIAQGFQAAQLLAGEVGTFLTDRGKQADAWTKANPGADPSDNPYAIWGAGGTGRLVLTALAGAARSNVTGSLGSFVQSSAVNVLRGLRRRR